jgi:hypothetical protein
MSMGAMLSLGQIVKKGIVDNRCQEMVLLNTLTSIFAVFEIYIPPSAKNNYSI